ncbi:hypothetical protein [Chryseobacterium sp. HMWF035]|uniref:hypothetical protein n=1 Tax=Chryseobacterium sp. HMWF035 TaxID=2056868 RepID=UPI000D5664C6|nr:hypothetical protein [Chryseobacterium sp. HMWF035]PVV57490.1 hypothetical protein DD829_08535 [Chryseobacterium sp. HMWF035]
MEKTLFYVIFEVLNIEQELKEGSTVKTGERLIGLYNSIEKTVTYTDVNGEEYVFPEKTCTIISKL